MYSEIATIWDMVKCVFGCGFEWKNHSLYSKFFQYFENLVLKKLIIGVEVLAGSLAHSFIQPYMICQY